MEQGRVMAMMLMMMVISVQVVTCLQSFNQVPQYAEVNPGQSAVLHCKINSKAGQCSWQKDGYPIGPEQNKYEWASEAELDSGDCSLRVLGADLKYDDGLWSCQVTASSFQTQDALSSAPAPLVVRVKPEVPQIVFASVAIASGRNLTARLDEVVTVECSSAGGNPPALIRWVVGEEDLTTNASQQNITDSEDPRTSTAVSTLRHSFRREQAGSYLRCVALHQAWESQSQDTIARLDLQYAPELSLVGLPSHDLEDNVSAAVLECRADANPPAAVVWRFAAAGSGRGHNFFVDKLEFRPVTRQNSGTYECEASNSIGKSRPLSVTLDIKYAPRIYRVHPTHHVTAALYNATALECEAEASPAVTYRWLQRGPHQAEAVRGTEGRLWLPNVTYEHRGHYICEATNVINGEQRSARSDPVHLKVVGAPQMVRAQSLELVPAVRGQEAVLEQRFCADPAPARVTWLWDDQQPLQAGRARGRYSADDVIQDSPEACYLARLRIQSASPDDEREYIVSAENDMGSDRHALILQVKGVPLLAEPVSMVTVIAIAGSGLLLLIVLIAIICHAFKKGQCCFSHKGGFKPTDIESEKPDANGHGETAGRNGLGAIPPDALYAGPKKAPQGIASYEFCGEDDEAPGGDGSWGGIIYADLQLPRASNNGSMRKLRHARRQSHLSAAPPTSAEPAIEYAVIRFPAGEGGSAEERTQV